MQRDDLLQSYINSGSALFKSWKMRYFEHLGEADLTPALVGVLFIVHQKQLVSGRDIASEMRITHGAVAHFVDTLVTLGYIERQSHPDDRRVSHVVLTAKGKSLMRKLDRNRRKLAEDVTANLTNHELRRAIDINSKILDNLDKIK